MADWGDLAENVARLVDRIDYWLQMQYVQWTADPDEVAAARRTRRKPPPAPIIPPVAARPPSLHERLSEDYLSRVVEFGADPSAPRMVTDDEFDSIMQL